MMIRAILLGALIVVFATSADAQGWRRDHYRHHGGGDFLGGFIGGVLGGVIANQPYYDRQPYYDPVADCMRRFRSYQPELGIYYGYDGRARRCP